jgi:Putative F0F1-ATPase subunit Ca2+/Mg2+ transporter
VADDEAPFRRGDARERTRRDLARLGRRDSGTRFWRSLALVGSVGWPIVLLATGGALGGQALDRRLGTGVRLTLMLLTLGTAIGVLLAFRAVRGDRT